MAADRVGEFTWLEFRVCGPSHLSVMVAANKGLTGRRSLNSLRRGRALRRTNLGRLYVHADPRRLRTSESAESGERRRDYGDRVIFPALLMGTYPWKILYNAGRADRDARRRRGFGVPLTEAQACGRLVVTTDFAVCRNWFGMDAIGGPAGRSFLPGELVGSA